MTTEIISHLKLILEGLFFWLVVIPAITFTGVWLLFALSGYFNKKEKL